MGWGAIVSCVGTAFSYLIGWNDVIEALLVAMAIDYVTGILAAYINPNLALNSQKGFKGICKKIVILLLVVWFFLGNEGLSIESGITHPGEIKSNLRAING